MKTLVKIGVVAVVVAGMSSCDWISNNQNGHDNPDSVVVPIDTTKGIVIIDSSVKAEEGIDTNAVTVGKIDEK